MRNSRKVLVDTSTLFSGLGWDGPPSELLKSLADSISYELTITDWILDELFRNVDRYPKERKIPAFTALYNLSNAYLITEDKWKGNLKRAKEEVEDEKDAPIMAAYLIDCVEFLVTSNASDFPIGEYNNIKTPKNFLKEIEKE